ncbi:DUF416 family protein [Sphingobacterium alkalisoli]|uniref:DUF416 family protein n=1 Tax=Sphingobacterium alkalisoli TaxID=1874115 RepID=A0A4U0GP84_9SPHI|nr:DUF416 family protein [Sphingobacterium alkalisoli]TJY60695.1 DUF416 family protein [Sphingobacterium alkalisoli]GGH31387.1 hypothetical protein GCM10011418_44130 [Sphingobacterium alkalisoli]
MDKYREEIEQLILGIPDRGKILFAALTAERLYPNYMFFQRINRWGKLESLGEGLSIIYQSLIKDDLFNSSEIEFAIANLEIVTPDTEEFPDITTSFALDACTSISSILSYLLEKNTEHIVDVAIFARDTVDMFIQEKYDIIPSDSLMEAKIANDPLMIKEKERQKKLLDRLRNIEMEIITDDFINSLRDKTPIIELEIFEK